MAQFTKFTASTSSTLRLSSGGGGGAGMMVMMLATVVAICENSVYHFLGSSNTMKGLVLGLSPFYR